MRDDLKPINIFTDGNPYKSIKQLTWENVPGLAILTGLNGSGKTQLLEILAYRPLGYSPLGKPTVTCNLRIEDENYAEGDIAYVPSEQIYGGGGTVGAQQLQLERDNLFNLMTQYNPNLDMAARARKARVAKLTNFQPNMTKQEFDENLPDDFLFMLDDVNISARIAHVFYAHRVRMLDRLHTVGSPQIVREQLGSPPWEVLDDILRSAAFPYRVQEPGSITKQYRFTLLDIASGEERNPDDLSSGEKVILEMVLWLFNVSNDYRLPRLFILDEPDAHLHPSMTRQFLDVLYEVLVKKHKIRVVMATHSSSTVALAPENCLFEMARGSLNITKSPSKEHTLGLLSSGLVIVSPSTKYVLVEDEDDVDFYGTLHQILSDYGPSKDARCLKTSPSIVFLPASLGRSKDKTGGGCTVVTKWVEKFEDGHLRDLFRGIIDRDKSNTNTDRVFVGERYAIENYFLDPLNIYCLLSQRAEAPKIDGLQITSGDEHLMRALEARKLQEVVNVICAKIQSDNVGLTDVTPTVVTFTNKIQLLYPKWMIESQGHELLIKVQKSWGGHSVIQILNLLQSYTRLRMIPVELADMLASIQG